MRLLGTIGITAGGVLAAGATAVALGLGRWRADAARAVERLIETPPPSGTPRRYDRAMLEGLPAPARRYFAFALTEGQPLVHRARIAWSGEFRLKAWAPFTATQLWRAEPPGFVWDAKIAMVPLVPAHVRDGYAGGEGEMRAAVLGLVPIVDQRGSKTLAESALLRWLGEAVWLPTALLPRDGIAWSPVSDSTARVTVTDGACTASLELDVAPDGRPLRARALRGRDVDGTQVPTPWEGTYGPAFMVVNGMRIPAESEVAWFLPEGRQPYWRGRPVQVAYAFAP